MPKKLTQFNEFKGQSFYIGIDVHKKSWTVTIRTAEIEVAHFSQVPDAAQLARYLQNRFPGGNYYSAYEAGFCGTRPHQLLNESGIANIVIHPADLPQTDKHRNSKTDTHDSRAIARYLEAGLLSGIYIMPFDQQDRRALFRCRQSKVIDVTRCINRLRGLLNYAGIKLPDHFKDKTYISQNFISWLEKLQLSTPAGTQTLQQYLEELKYQRRQLLLLTKNLKNIMAVHYKESYYSLLSVPGIGPVVAMAILAETGDLSRFGNPDEYISYLGFIPGEQSSGGTVYSNYIQPRCNRHLRPLLIEAAWAAIRRCPDLLCYYKKHFTKNNKKAIIKVARKLSLIAKAVAVNQTMYQSGYVAQHLIVHQ